MEKETVDVDAIDICLIGTEEEIEHGLKLIDSHFREKIVEVIRKKALSANEHDLFEIYQEVLLGIFQKAKDGRYDPDNGYLKALLYSVANNKAIEWLREKTAQKRNPKRNEKNEEVLIDSVAEAIKDSNMYEPWQYAHQNEERAKILETIRNIVPKLKLRQRQVAEIIIENFPDQLDIKDIKRLILERYGEDVTSLSVKSARQEVYKKVKDGLVNTGYGE